MRLLKKILAFARRVNELTHPFPSLISEWGRLSAAKAAEEANRIISEDSIVFSKHSSFRVWAFEEVLQKSGDGLVLDFGVRGGTSTIQLASAGHHVYGFDAFEGLRDPWSKPNRGPGSLNMGGEVPAILKDNPKISIVKGWVEDTLPGFLENHKGSIKLAHLDLDVFPPTRFVLESIVDRLVSGSMLVFDDFFGHIGWENHSYKAFHLECERKKFVVSAVSPQGVVFTKI